MTLINLRPFLAPLLDSEACIDQPFSVLMVHKSKLMSVLLARTLTVAR